MLTIADIDRAHSLIAGHVRRTPVIAVEGALFGLAEPVCLKLEMLQHAGSFKPRGAFNRILGAAAPARCRRTASSRPQVGTTAWPSLT